MVSESNKKEELNGEQLVNELNSFISERLNLRDVVGKPPVFEKTEKQKAIDYVKQFSERMRDYLKRRKELCKEYLSQRNDISEGTKQITYLTDGIGSYSFWYKIAEFILKPVGANKKEINQLKKEYLELIKSI